MTLAVLVHRVGTVDDDIALRQQRHQPLQRLVRGRSSRQHQPDDSRRWQVRHEFLQRDDRNQARLAGKCRSSLDRPVPGDHHVARTRDAAAHVAAHRPSPIIPSVRFIAFRPIAAHRGRSMVARCRVVHKGALGAGLCAWRGGARTGTDGSCYNNRCMHHELDNLRRPRPGAGA